MPSLPMSEGGWILLRERPSVEVAHDDEVTTGKRAWAHLNEVPDDCPRLAEMEAEAERYWSGRPGGSAA